MDDMKVNTNNLSAPARETIKIIDTYRGVRIVKHDECPKGFRKIFQKPNGFETEG